MAQVPVTDNTNFNLVKPFMAWNRLETRPRKKQFERVLKAEIHDPLWMLGRQWQMGEFKGNDTGSGILARVQMDYHMLSGIAAYNQAPEAYNGELPLEALVEQVTYNWSEKERIVMGRKWFALLQEYGFPLNSYQTLLYADPDHEFTVDTEEPAVTADEDEVMDKANILSNASLLGFLSAAGFAGTRIDGGKVYEMIGGSTLLANVQARYQAVPGNGPMPSADQLALQGASAAFALWVRKMYTLPATSQDNWNKRSLEYQFDAFVPDDGSNPSSSGNLRLTADAYHQGHFDWYAFEQDATNYGTSPVVPETKNLQLIMSESRFAGMPASRWWEFENGAVNFAQLDANTTDMAKIILTQFALVYQDDWFTIPYKVRTGSYSEIKGIVVTDVFGVKTYVANYNVDDYTSSGFTEYYEGWKKWGWMEISQKAGAMNTQAPIRKLLVPPVVSKMQESKPLESVLFIRDEVSDMVWGIEKTVPDRLGKGKDGYEYARSYKQYLSGFKPAPEIPVNPADPDAKIRYELASTEVPENWIPFIPVSAGTGMNNRSIQLQRASMPRILPPYETSLVRPRTELLRYGLNGSNVLPYFINEEEITRAGTIVETSIQRTRWYDGKVVSWVGRRKYTGRGEGSSGLVFDSVKNTGS